MAQIDNTCQIDINEFTIRIFVVGGQKGDGEGILILFFNGSNVIRTISIDCCQTIIHERECNLLCELLEHFHVENIDCFVWTHPHDDHSKGLDGLVDKYYRKSSIGIIPKQIYGVGNDIVKMRPTSMKVLRKINSKFSKKNLKSIDCQENEKRCVYSFQLEDIFSSRILPVSLYCLTPIDFILDDKRRNNQTISDSLLNEISLSLILDVDGYCFFFGGDAPDKTLKETDRQSLYGCKWVKIPHHGSKSSMNAVSSFNRAVDSAVAVSFLSQKLPNKEVIERYKTVTNQIYITQKSKEDPHPFGMVEYLYSFKDSRVQLKITRYGNAYKYE